MDLSLFFAGTGGSVPSARRGLPAVLVRRGGDRLLFDCGEGTQRQLLRSVGLADMECVFITHFHADHWLGLPGMLKSFALRDREQPLTIYGPRGTQRADGRHALHLRAATAVRAHRSPSSSRREAVERRRLPRRGRPGPPPRRLRFGYALVEDAAPGAPRPASSPSGSA